MSNLEFSDIQGLVFSGYGKRMTYASYYPLRISKAAPAREWLKALMQANKVTHGDQKKEDWCLNIAFTQKGLKVLDLDANDINTFDKAFVDGMDSERREKLLQDTEASSPKKWQWGSEKNTVDVLLMIFCKSEEIMQTRGQQEQDLYEKHGLSLILDKPLIPTVIKSSSDEFRKEHFGFADGISQPDVRDFPDYARVKEGMKDGQEIAPGEFVLGYQNEYDRQTQIPQITSASALGEKVNFGKNGTYLVFRQLEQNVPAFWNYFKGQAKDKAEEEWLASKCVGRWSSGVLVSENQTKDPGIPVDNKFNYSDDKLGMGCPLGSHIRRSNPRAQGLGENPEQSLKVASLHRIIRRGRGYGSPVTDRYQKDTEKRGLFFLCINANIERQFEFIQHTWINNVKFNALYDEKDPVVGSPQKGEDNPMSIPRQSIRKRLHKVDRFVTTRGGAYFFLPGLAALRTLAGI